MIHHSWRVAKRRWPSRAPPAAHTVVRPDEELSASPREVLLHLRQHSPRRTSVSTDAAWKSENRRSQLQIAAVSSLAGPCGVFLFSTAASDPAIGLRLVQLVETLADGGARREAPKARQALAYAQDAKMQPPNIPIALSLLHTMRSLH